MKVFYHDDLDGRCAAHIINNYDNWPTEERDIRPINYGIEFPFDDIDVDERVYILDYSIEPEEMLRLLAITENIIWIDHHKTAIEKYKDFPVEIQGLRQISTKPDDFPAPMAGCELTYRWVWWNILKKGEHKQEDSPEYIRLIGDRDTWTWKYGKKAKHFCTGLQAYDTSPLASVWNSLRYEHAYVNHVILEGRTIQCYKDRTQQEYIRTNGFWIDFHDYKCYAANGRFDSHPFEAVVPEADIWLTFRYMKDGYWMISLYTDKDIDVSEIAKEYKYHGKRGGGHKQAAGFECIYPPFLDQSIIDPDKLMELNMR